MIVSQDSFKVVVDKLDVGAQVVYFDEDGVHEGKIVEMVAGVPFDKWYEKACDAIEDYGYDLTTEFVLDGCCYFIAVEFKKGKRFD